MQSTKMVSFDWDGTIADISFVNSVWLEGVPRSLVSKNHVSLEDAKRLVTSEYAKVGRERLEWYDLQYWIERFDLDVSREELLNSYQDKIKIYPEVVEVLESFSRSGLRLVVVSNARREFIDLELEKTHIQHFFEQVFSSTSDFGLVKTTVGPYREVCRICGISPGEVVHVGDDRRFDFDVPTSLGIRSFYLDRTGKESGESIVHTLTELKEKLVKQE